MDITIIARKGAQSTNAIGKFLLEFRDEFIKKPYNFDIRRISPNDEEKYANAGIKTLPVLIMNKKTYYGTESIITQLNTLIRRETETFEFNPGAFKMVNGKHVFEDDEPEKFDLSQKLKDFQEKKTKKIVYKVDQSRCNNGLDDLEDFVVDENEIDLEKYNKSLGRGTF